MLRGQNKASMLMGLKYEEDQVIQSVETLSIWAHGSVTKNMTLRSKRL